MHIGETHVHAEFTYNLDGNILEQVDEEKDIGDIIDSELRFNKHIPEKVKKANPIFVLIRRIFKHLDERTFIKLYKTLVRTHLDCAKISIVFLPKKKTC
jgi:hypothetical protein